MRILLIVAFFAAAVSLNGKPALAAMCGPSSDVTHVENGTVGNFNAHLPSGMKKIDKTYIMQLAVVGVYAEVTLDFPKGPLFAFWIKKSGNWTYSGDHAPKGWPGPVTAKLTAMNGVGPNGKQLCANPKWINRSSSG